MKKGSVSQLEVAWNTLISIASEQAAAMVNSSFSAVLGEMEDLSAGVFDATGTMMAQSVQGAPGHLGSLSLGLKHFCRAFPERTLQPGDVLITNDPWLVSGHKHDISIATPVFLGKKLVGFTASNCHTVDIGGRIFSAAGTDVFEEGLQLPMMKLFNRGERDETLFRLLRANVRSPELVIGDLMAQVAANESASRRLVDFMRGAGLRDLCQLSRAITERTERFMRKAIGAVPNGEYRDRIELDGFEQPLHVEVKLTVAGDRIVVDYTGTSPQVPKGINSVLNYTHAFTQYALKCLLAPDSPNNDGSFVPIEVRAPEGSILNASFPAPVGGRHLVGLYIPFAVFGAMREVLPERVVADSSVLSAVTLNGTADDGRPYVFTFFSSGGMGARAGKDGLDATAFPSNVANVPVEVMEQSVPILMTCRELIAGSAGQGMHRGGAGQRIGVELRTGRPASVSCMVERTSSAPRGFRGGDHGRPARVLLNGAAIDPKHSHTLAPGQSFVLETPGGGGYGSPSTERKSHA
jgi:N-methylhydantoinase B